MPNHLRMRPIIVEELPYSSAPNAPVLEVEDKRPIGPPMEAHEAERLVAPLQKPAVQLPRSNDAFPLTKAYASNLQLRVLRLMATCGVQATDARMDFVRAVCALRLLRGNSQRKHAVDILFVILQDHRVEQCVIPGVQKEARGKSVLELGLKNAVKNLRDYVLRLPH